MLLYSSTGQVLSMCITTSFAALTAYKSQKNSHAGFCVFIPLQADHSFEVHRCCVCTTEPILVPTTLTTLNAALLYSKQGSQSCQSPSFSQDFCVIHEFELLLEVEFMCSFWTYTI